MYNKTHLYIVRNFQNSIQPMLLQNRGNLLLKGLKVNYIIVDKREIFKIFFIYKFSKHPPKNKIILFGKFMKTYPN